MPSSCESLGAGYLACPRFNRMLTLCKGISRDRAAASENESWSGFVPNFIVYTNPKSTLRFRRRRCDVKKKKTQARNVSPSRPSSKRVCYVCVCVLEGEGEGTRTYLRLGSPPGRSSSVSRCVVEGRRKTRVRGLVVLGSVTWFFFFSFFRRLTPRTWRRRTWLPCALLSLSLSLSLSCRGLARALRGDAGRVRVRARVCTSSGLPFPSREGGEDLRTTRFLLDFPR